MVKACRIWLRESDGDLYVPPDLILPSTFKLSSEKIEIKLAKHPLVNALLRHYKWQITPEYKDYALLEARISGETGRLTLPGNAAKYDVSIPKPEDAIAYYLPSSNNKPLTIEVTDKITGFSQVVINEGGFVQASPNLSGQLIKVRQLITFNQATQQLMEKLEKINAYFILKSEDNFGQQWKYLEFKRCEYEAISEGRIKLINWENNREEVYEFST